MNDTELADALVERGIGSTDPLERLETAIVTGLYWLDDPDGMIEEEFVRDWRVAGACLEKMTPFHLQFLAELLNTGDIRCPRAICMAFVEATK